MPKVPAQYLEARRESIIDAARRAFVRKGTEATTMAEIARESGLTPGALYRYFPNKDDLIKTCFREAMSEVSARWMELRDAAIDPLDDLAELSRLTFAELEKPDEWMNSMIHLEHELAMVRDGNEAALAEWRAERLAITEKIRARLAAGQKQGRLSNDVDATLLAQALFSFYWGARLTRILEPDADTTGQLEQLLTLVRNATE